MKEILVALVKGDGAAPEMMQWACEVVIKAAEKDKVRIRFEETPMGWNAYEKYGDTLPVASFRRAVNLGTIFFGGVGDPKFDNTIGVEKPEMKPEARCLLALRKEMGLLLNFRPMIYYPELRHLANVKPETIPDEGIKQIWIRFLLEDSYFGNETFLNGAAHEMARHIGVKLKSEVTGKEKYITDIAFYIKDTVEKYARSAFAHAKSLGLPLISIDKANVMPRYDFWRKIFTQIGKEEFPDVKLSHQYVDSANALLFTPAKLHGVIACGNEHGDILSDGAAAALGSMGMMCSSAINPDNRKGMFESGAGTAPTLTGTNKANSIGRFLTGAMMLRHLSVPKGADSIEFAVRKALIDGWRTHDMCGSANPLALASPGYKEHVLGTKEMGQLILSLI